MKTQTIKHQTKNFILFSCWKWMNTLEMNENVWVVGWGLSGQYCLTRQIVRNILDFISCIEYSHLRGLVLL